MITGEILAGYTAKQIIAPGFEMRRGKMSWGFGGVMPGEWIRS